jgi:hypothetical protein
MSSSLTVAATFPPSSTCRLERACANRPKPATTFKSAGRARGRWVPAFLEAAAREDDIALAGGGLSSSVADTATKPRFSYYTRRGSWARAAELRRNRWPHRPWDRDTAASASPMRRPFCVSTRQVGSAGSDAWSVRSIRPGDVAAVDENAEPGVLERARHRSPAPVYGEDRAMLGRLIRPPLVAAVHVGGPLSRGSCASAWMSEVMSQTPCSLRASTFSVCVRRRGSVRPSTVCWLRRST